MKCRICGREGELASGMMLIAPNGDLAWVCDAHSEDLDQVLHRLAYTPFADALAAGVRA